MWLLAREICRWLLVCCKHVTAAGSWVASGGVPLCPGGAAADPCPAAPFAWTAGVGRGCVVLCLGAQRLAAGPPGDSAGWVPGTMPGAGRLQARDVRRAGHDRCPVGPAPVFGRLVRRRETPLGRGCHGTVPTPAPPDGAGASPARRVPPALARRQGTAPGGGPQGTQAGSAWVAAVAQTPPASTDGRSLPRATDPAGSA